MVVVLPRSTVKTSCPPPSTRPSIVGALYLTSAWWWLFNLAGQGDRLLSVADAAQCSSMTAEGCPGPQDWASDSGSLALSFGCNCQPFIETWPPLAVCRERPETTGRSFFLLCSSLFFVNMTICLVLRRDFPSVLLLLFINTDLQADNEGGGGGGCKCGCGGSGWSVARLKERAWSLPAVARTTEEKVAM